MDLQQAKQILTGMGLEDFNSDRIAASGDYMASYAGDDQATLDGRFTADELEAIATWMRNPSGVVEA